MSIQSTGKWGFNYHRAFAEFDTKGATKHPLSQETGFRYYDKKELENEKGYTWKAFKAAVLMLIGKTVKIDGKECIIGRRSFKEFITRVDSDNLGLKALDMQACINKLCALKGAQKMQVIESMGTQQVKKQAEDLAGQIGKTDDPVVRRSPSMQNLQQAIVEFGKHPDDPHAEQVERAIEAVETREPDAAEHLAIMPGSREASPARSREASPARSSEEAEGPRKSEKQKAMERLTKWRGSEFQWVPKPNVKRGLQEIWEKRAKINNFDEDQFIEDIKHFKFIINKGKIVGGRE